MNENFVKYISSKMVSHSALVRSISQPDLMNELHFFIKGASRLDKSISLELTKTSLSLLKSLPASRTAVFEYFCRVFDGAAQTYIENLETEINTGELPKPCETDEAVVSEIHVVLVNLITERPDAWAPIVSTWSLELLGEISTKYAGRAHISSNLNETLQLWMGCRATRTLVDINTKCFTSLMHSDTEACISALLDTSVKHSPNFDWVVAHVGSCFPNTVITRVLSVGLKDFCQNKSYDQGINSPKLRSVVGILGHLAGSHVSDIRAAILEMFEWSLKQANEDNDQVRLQKKATVPYILHLAYLSSTLLSSICIDIKHTLSVEVIETLFNFIEDWSKYFGTPEALEDLIVSLILKCETGGIHIINLLLDCIHSDSNGSNVEKKLIIKDKSCEILQNILDEIDGAIRHRNTVNLLNSFAKDVDEIHRLLMSSEMIKQQTSARIVVFLGHDNPSILIRSATFLFKEAKTSEHLALLIKILMSELVDKTASPYAEKGGHFSVVLSELMSRNIQQYCSVNKETSDLTYMWKNLLTLLRWEKSGQVSLLNSQFISKAIESNLESLSSLFKSETVHMHILADILDMLEVPSTDKSYCPSIQIVLSLTESTVNYFFKCCEEEGTSSKLQGFKKVSRILKRLCTYSKVARVLALRELLERSLFCQENVLFGAKNNAIPDGSSEKFLLKQNKNINKTIPLTKHSSVFNGGIIGTGKRKAVSPNELPKDVVADNKTQLIYVLKACCSLPDDSENKFTDTSLESMTIVSLLLVHFVSPDVMYNGLPWPEEEFSKVTIERDLFIRRLFTSTPLLWDLLNFVAVHRPALCYCSVLLRALTATLIHQWKSMGAQSKSNGTDNYNSLMDTTVKVIDVMALGQLLPPPLSHIRDVVPHLKHYEIVAILKDCIWCYLRDHVPSPALFVCDLNGINWRDPTIARPPEAYTNTLRIIMQKNISTLGGLYKQMFINVAKQE